MFLSLILISFSSISFIPTGLEVGKGLLATLGQRD